MEPRSETWESFWARKLRIEFFDGQWEMYRRVADARAEWLEENFGLDRARPLLSCACGEGGIELALARRGFNVTAIDRCGPLIHFAREQAAQEKLTISFITADLRDKAPLPGGNGTVCCFDTLGLLASEDEEQLAKRMAAALGPEGVLLVDSPSRDELRPGRTWNPVGEGHLLLETRWEKGAATQVIEPLFIEGDGSRVVLQDPYDQTLGEHTGVQRYVYSPAELTRLVEQAGLAAEVVPHQRRGYFIVVGRRE